MTLQVKTEGIVAEVTFSMSDSAVVVGTLLLIVTFGTMAGIVLARMVAS